MLKRLSSARGTDPDVKLLDSDSVVLADNLKQQHLKVNLFKELHDRIIYKTEDEDKMEEAVYEAADLQAMLSERIAIIAHMLSTNSGTTAADRATTNTVTQETNPPPQSSIEPQPVQQRPETHISDANTHT